MKVSIVILTKNEEAFIAGTLESVFQQVLSGTFEVIVIDSGSKDKTIDIVKQYPVRIIEIPALDFGHGRTRNLGVNNSQGDYIVFLNGDATPANNYWLAYLLEPFSLSKNVAGVYSRIYPRTDCNPLEARDILNDRYLFDERIKNISASREYNQMNAEEKRKLISFHTISCVVDRRLLSESPFMDVPFGEDLEWAKRMLEKGYTVAYEPKAAVLHSHNLHRSFPAIMKKYFDDTRLNQQLLKRWRISRLLRVPIVTIFKIIRDIAYIFALKRTVFYKIRWILYSPIMRIAEALGIFLGAMPYISNRFIRSLSLVEEIKRR